MSEFSPVQLDALEDALEDLEFSGIPAELEDDGAVVERLGEYRDLLQFSRVALELEEVPAGALAGVLAEAREVVALEPAAERPPPQAEETVTPWWRRIGLWIPALAVGASAALVLVLVNSTLPAADEPAVVARVEESANPAGDQASQKAEEKLILSETQLEGLQAAAEPKDAPSGDDALPVDANRGRLRGMGAGRTDDAPRPQIVEEARSEAEADGDGSLGGVRGPDEGGKRDRRPSAKPSTTPPAPAKGKKKSSKGSVPSAGPRNAPARPAPAQPALPDPAPSGAKSEPASGGGAPAAEAPATDPWGGIAEADALRRKGRCGSAEPKYRASSKSDDTKVRARAWAGLGLCALTRGDNSSAESLFTRARQADSSVAAFIEAQRPARDQSQAGPEQQRSQ